MVKTAYIYLLDLTAVVSLSLGEHVRQAKICMQLVGGLYSGISGLAKNNNWGSL